MKPITEKQFRQLSPKLTPPPGSFARALQLQTRETQWFEDKERARIGVIVLDTADQDWQAITLEQTPSGYSTHEVRASIATEPEAVEVLRSLFEDESGGHHQLVEELNQKSKENTGQDLVDIFYRPFRHMTK